MQMESWRDKGFVPDSEEDEEDYESQGSKKVFAKDEDEVPLTTHITEAQDKQHEFEAGIAEDGDGDHPTVEHEQLRQSVELGSEDDELAEEVQYAKTNKKLKKSPSLNLKLAPKDAQLENALSSSEDELQVFVAPRQKPASTPTPKTPTRQPDFFLRDDDSLSSLSPPPSTLASPWHSQGETHRKSPLPAQQPLITQSSPQRPHTEQSVVENMDNPVDEAGGLNNLENILPVGILQELSQPVRRSLRQRNPIQLHPYLLEDAKYRGLLKGAGIKPVRVALMNSDPPHPQNDSHETALGPTEPPSSSPPEEFIFPPSSPPDPYKSPRPREQHRTPNSLPRNTPGGHYSESHPKRRKLFHSTAKKDDVPKQLSMQVVIDNTNGPQDREMVTVDAPLSPPRSGSLSSVGTARPVGFRFPRGFSPPPMTTSVTATEAISRDGDDVTARDEMEIDAPLEISDETPSPVEDRSSEEDTWRVKEDEVKKLQRKIKGVLPASWLRLDLKHRGEKSSTATHERRQRELQATQTEPAKGVARKITRTKSTATHSPIQRHRHEFSFSSSSSEDESMQQENPREALAKLVGFEDPFNDVDDGMDDDIPEDNRIDDMFPPVPKSSIGPSRPRLKKPKTYSTKKTNHFSRRNARRDMQRQTRIEDSIPRQRTQPRPKPQAPRLGILDAPDVAERPRAEQPQFLRIAARQARSRRDQGRSSPGRKIFQMVNRNDMEDTNKVLREWKSGIMKQSKLPAPRVRKSMCEPLSGVSNIKRHGTKERRVASARVHQSTEEARPQLLADLSSESETETPAHPAVSLAEKRFDSAVRAKPKRLGYKWIVSRAFGISSLTRNAPRPAEFEVGFQTGQSPNVSLGTSLAALNQTYRRDHGRKKFGQSLTLDRFLTTSASPSKPSPGKQPRQDQPPSGPIPKNRNQDRQRVIKKRPPTRIDINHIDDEPQITTFSESLSASMTSVDNLSTPGILNGLKNYNTFSIDFNITPLRVGTFFHDSTFIGQNEFSRSLDIETRILDQDNGFVPICFGDQMFRWGAWNDTVSSELGIVFESTIKDTTVQSSQTVASPTPHDNLHTLVSVTRYVTDKLSFSDPIDRIAFVDRAVYLSSELKDYVTAIATIGDERRERCLRLASLNIVFANQVRQIASHRLVDSSKLEYTLGLVKDLSRQLLSLVFNRLSLAEIRRFYDECKIAERREAGIRDNFPSVEAYVLVFQLLQSSEVFKGWFQEITLSLIGEKMFSAGIQLLEDSWRAIFTTLPLNEIDKFGIARPGSRFHEKHDNWPVVQRLVANVLDAYDPNSKFPISYINYCRSLFHRCFALMASWGWRDCKAVLETLFDFFAKHMLYNLKNEESFGSPSFLDHLDSNPTLEVQAGDSCFHIFLKIVGSGLRYLSGIYSKKKLMNFAWRLLPNHGRVYPKEKPLHHEDLDALRNHHDLLCTLYWAVPDGCRPRIGTIQDLVDPATSHLATCSLSIRSWRRLTLFKLSTDEDVSGLKPFADWYGYFVSELVRQHILARTEVESQANGEVFFSKQSIESTISENQRQIESLISSTLLGMKASIESARSLEYAHSLITGVPFGKLLGLFNPTQSRINGVIKETLQLIITFIDKDPVFKATIAPTVANDDSQEYGDWSAIEEIYDDAQEPAKPNEAIFYLKNIIQPDISQLISNCFGEDRSPEDSLLLKATECWSCLAQLFVKHGLDSWDSYLNPYGKHSWTALRTTPQTRKFTSQFLATCIEKDRRFFTECRTQILAMWMSCLVERKSMLKFQHRLTEILLNEDGKSTLFQNLPFHRDRKDDRYHITLPELTDRRITLISSLLSNMREHLQDLEDSASRGLASAREEYRELIMALMISMKANYQELGQSTNSTQGQYVEFVHRVVGFMQQHSQTICPIDKFFTDTTSFPLPADDPTYIVARLKSYGVRLSTGKPAKQLIMFLQSVSERAAMDGQQDYLIEQLCTCTSEAYETGDPNRPSLRSFLLQCVFPSYIECSFSKATAWIFAWPILKAISRIFSGLIYEIDINDSSCVLSVNTMIEAVFQSIHRAMRLTVDHSGLLAESPALVLLQSCVEVITSSLPILDYLKRMSVISNQIISLVQTLRKNTLFAVATLLDPSMAADPGPDDGLFESSTSERFCPAFFVESRAFATRELQTWLHTRWAAHDGKYFLRHGQQSKEIDSGIVRSKEVRNFEHAKTAFINTTETFLVRLKELNLLDERDLEPTKMVFEDSFLYDYDGIEDGIDALLL